MPNPMGAGFFGKLPATGDFVQRRLPAAFTEVWDRHFEQAVSASRARLGEAWVAAWREAAPWRFVLPPGVCGEQAWAGLTGPASDRVGRCFPMTIATPLAGLAAIGEALRNDAWFAAAERVHGEGQGGGLGVDAFDARVAELPDPLDPPTELHAGVPRLDWRAASHWRLPLPPPGVDGRFLAALWTQLQAQPGLALWWTTGAPRMPPCVLVTRGLPEPAAYAGMLDVACADAPWQTPGAFAAVSAPASRPAPAAVPSLPPVAAAPVAPPAVRLPDDLSDLLGDLAPPPHAPAPADADATVRTVGSGGVRVLHRHDCALTVVAADDGAPDPRRQAATAVGELVGRFVPSDFVAGMQALRTRLLVLHSRLQPTAAEHGGSVQEDGAVIAVHVTGRWADLLRIGSASAWHWHAGQLRSLFASAGEAAPVEGAGLGGELDDLLFSRTSPVAPGLGSPGQPTCDEVVCEIEPGDRLLLLATRALAELASPLLAEALALPTPAAACAHVARAVGLGLDAASWPLAVIEVQP
jgi:type VI secretion system ImpM family protein